MAPREAGLFYQEKYPQPITTDRPVLRENARELARTSASPPCGGFLRAHFHAGGISDSGVVCQGEGTAVCATQRAFILLALR